MSIYSYNQAAQRVEVVDNKGNKKDYSVSKATALAFGYMAIGLAITAIVAFGTGFLTFFLLTATNLDPTAVLIGYMAVIVIGAIGCIATSIVIGVMNRKGKSIVVPSILYCVFMGCLFAAFILAGVDPWTIGEAFLITAGVFLVMFLIGYFSKVDFSPIAFFGMMLFFLLAGAGLFVFIALMINGFNSAALFTTYFYIELGMYLLMAVLILVVVAIDAGNIKKTLARASGDGKNQNNLILACAMTMYCDFIMILIRVIYILALSKKD